MGFVENHDLNWCVSRELRNLRFLEKHSQGSLSSSYIVHLLDSFTHEGPNGVHHCLVFELLDPSVDKVLADYHGVTTAYARDCTPNVRTAFESC